MKLWNARTGEVILTIQGRTNAFTSVALSPDGNRIVSGGVDKTVKVWEASRSQAKVLPP